MLISAVSFEVMGYEACGVGRARYKTFHFYTVGHNVCLLAFGWCIWSSKIGRKLHSRRCTGKRGLARLPLRSKPWSLLVSKTLLQIPGKCQDGFYAI